MNPSFPEISKTTVNQDKLLIFLEEQAVGRLSDGPRQDVPKEIPQFIGMNSIKNYVNAISKLWELQNNIK